jgi:uncharacterized protein (TIGR02145 family)
LKQGVYYSDGTNWIPVTADESASAGTNPPVVISRHPALTTWLGLDGSLLDSLSIDVAATEADKAKFKYQWYRRNPDTHVSDAITGATTSKLFFNSANGTNGSVSDEGKVYEFYCVVINGSQAAISEAGHVVYGTGAWLDNGRWIKIANANLGAVLTKPLAEQMAYPSNELDPTVYGDLYQWGRKQDGHEDRTKQEIYSEYVDKPVGIGLVDSLNSTDGQIKDGLDGVYGIFIRRNGGTNDWRAYPETAENSAITPANAWTWGNPVNGITELDPCRTLGTGWRVPTQSEWVQIYANNTWIWKSGGTNGTSGYEIKPGGATRPTVIFLPVAGSRNNGSGQMYNSGVNGYYWSTTTYGDFSYGLYFNSNSSSIKPTSSYSRAYGFSVRCIAD